MNATSTTNTTPGHLMRAEIEQQQHLFRTWADDGGLVSTDLLETIKNHNPSVVLTVARGTSDRAADYGKYLLEILLGIPVGSTSPSTVTLFGAKPDARSVLALAISQSGESPDIVAETQALRAGGAFVLAITNSPNSPLAHTANAVIDIAAGPENAVAATKSFTSECAALADLAYGLAGKQLDRHAIADAVTRATTEPAPIHAANILDPAIQQSKFLVCIGRGPSTPIASEGALKIMETSGVPALGYSAADFAHGPRTLVSGGVPVIVVAPPGPAHTSVEELIDEIAQAHAPLIVLGNAHQATLDIPTHLHDPLTAPLEQVVTLQRIALELAILRGNDPDHPRSLSKVTLTT